MGLELTIDVDRFQLVDQDQRWVPPGRNIARCDGDRNLFVGAVAKFLHDLPRFGASPRDIGAAARQGLQDLVRHAPQALRRRLHRAANRAPPGADNVDERLTVQGQ
jgi:hypothetical protein